jgi:hypothetical protein
MKAIASASSRVFRVLTTAPTIGTPKCVSYISGVFASITATVSPTPMPRCANAEASRRQRRYVSAHVNARAPCTTARRPGYANAARSMNDSGVNGA